MSPGGTYNNIIKVILALWEGASGPPPLFLNKLTKNYLRIIKILFIGILRLKWF